MISDIPRYTDARFSVRVGPIHLVESWNSSLDRTEEPDNPAPDRNFRLINPIDSSPACAVFALRHGDDGLTNERGQKGREFLKINETRFQNFSRLKRERELSLLIYVYNFISNAPPSRAFHSVSNTSVDQSVGFTLFTLPTWPTLTYPSLLWS